MSIDKQYKMIKKALVILAFGIALTGCATPKAKVSRDYLPVDGTNLTFMLTKDSGVAMHKDQFQQLESKIRQGLSARGVLAPNKSSAQHSVVINVHSFRMREDAERLLVGIFAGCDYINSSVIVTDIATGNEVGKSKVSIKECASLGVAWQVINKYANGVVDYLSNDQDDSD